MENQYGNHEILKNADDNVEELFFKFILVGDAGVGKTSLLNRYVENLFSDQYHSTVGVEFGSKMIEISDTLRLKLQIWDTAGQESFTSITRSFYRNAHCIFLVYDINNQDTFENLDSWYENVVENVDQQSILVLVGNKSDIATESREVTYNAGISFMKEHNMHFFFETSAQAGKNVDLAFLEAAKFAHISYSPNKEAARESLRQKTRDTIEALNIQSLRINLAVNVESDGNSVLPGQLKDICCLEEALQLQVDEFVNQNSMEK